MSNKIVLIKKSFAFLAATKQLYKSYFLSASLWVCESVRYENVPTEYGRSYVDACILVFIRIFWSPEGETIVFEFVR